MVLAPLPVVGLGSLLVDPLGLFLALAVEVFDLDSRPEVEPTSTTTP